MPHELCRYNCSQIMTYQLKITFLKVGSIQVILDSLNLKTEEKDYDEENQPRGEQKPARPISLSKNEPQKEEPKKRKSLTASVKKNMRGKQYVRRLISNNIKEIEFLYRVNFQAGKGQND